MSRVVVALSIVLALVGLGVGFGLARAGRVEPPRPDAPHASAREMKDSGAGTTTTSLREDAPSATDLSRAVSALSSARAESDAELTASMSGTVVDLQGQPVPSLVVRALCNTNTYPGAPEFATSYDQPPEAVLLHYAKAYHYRRDHTREATTDEAGAFRIEELSDDLKYTLDTPREDLRLVRSTSRRPVKISEPKSDVELVAVPMGHVEIEIPALEELGWTEPVQLLLTPTSSADPEVKLSDRSLQSERGSSAHVWRPTKRRASGPAGLCQITPSYRADIVIAEPVFVELVAGQTTFVSLPVERKFSVSGRLLMAGLPASRGRVTLLPGHHDVTDRENLERIKREISRENSGLNIPDSWLSSGDYDLKAPAGEHTLVYGRDYSQVDGTEMIVLDRDTVLDIELPDDTANSVVVVLSGPNGPITNPSFSVTGRYKGGSFSNSGSNYSAFEPGKYRLFPLQSHQAEQDWTLAIAVTVPDLGRKEIEVELGQTYEVQFSEPASLRVDLVGIENCRFRSGLNLELEPVIEGSSDAPRGSYRNWSHNTPEFDLEKESSVEIDPVAPGSYTVRLLNTGIAEWGQIVLDETTVVVRDGVQTATLRVPVLHRVEIIAAEGDNHGNFAALSEDDKSIPGRQISIRAVGSMFVLNGIPRGRYRVQIWGQQDRTQIIDVQGDGKFEIENKTFVELKVSVKDPEGAMGTAGLQDDDRIVGVGGVLFSDVESMKAEYASWLSLSSVVLTVRRDESDFSLTIDPRIFFDPGAGGRVHPRRN